MNLNDPREKLLVELVAWRGDYTALAATLRMNPEELLNRLHRLTRGARKSPLRVEVALANDGPVFGALRRRLIPPDD